MSNFTTDVKTTKGKGFNSTSRFSPSKLSQERFDMGSKGSAQSKRIHTRVRLSKPERSQSGKRLEINVGELPNGQKLIAHTRNDEIMTNQ